MGRCWMKEIGRGKTHKEGKGRRVKRNDEGKCRREQGGKNKERKKRQELIGEKKEEGREKNEE